MPVPTRQRQQGEVIQIGLGSLESLLAKLIEALNQPMLKPEVSVVAPVSVTPSISAPAVQVNVPETTVNVESPIVNLDPHVDIAAPEVVVDVHPVFQPKSSVADVQRGRDGLIVRVVTTYTY